MVQGKLSDSFEIERTKTQISSIRSAGGQGITTIVNIPEDFHQLLVILTETNNKIESIYFVIGPTIEEFPKETYVIEGEEVSFKVVVSGYPQPSIQWYHNKDEVVEDYSTELDQNGSLHIPCSEKQHSGMYKLVARNSSGSVEKQVELKVLDEYQAPSPKDVDLSPVPVMEFGSFVANNHKNSNVGFKAMYQVRKINDSDFFVPLFLNIPHYKLRNCVTHTFNNSCRH